MVGGWSRGTCYSLRHLTYSSDRLPALSGLAHEVQRVIQCKYLAGIWECHLLAGLLWTTREVVKQRQDSSANGNPVSLANGDPQAPSWSWAASNYPVSYISPVIRDYIDGIRIIDMGTVTDGTDLMGRVSSGWITLNGPALEMCCLWEQATPSNAWLNTSFLVVSNNIEGEPSKPEQSQQTDDPGARLNYDNYDVSAEFDEERCITSTVTCLAFCTPVNTRQVHGLMLCSTDREGEYRRVGCWSGGEPYSPRRGVSFGQFWAKFTRRTITLV